jgi:hypothetical protein
MNLNTIRKSRDIILLIGVFNRYFIPVNKMTQYRPDPLKSNENNLRRSSTSLAIYNPLSLIVMQPDLSNF